MGQQFVKHIEIDQSRRWYLGGPMTGYDEFNYPAFAHAEEFLTNEWGLKIRSAHKVDMTGVENPEWDDYMKRTVRMLLECDGAIFLQGWPQSKGARVEMDVAIDLGYPIYQFMQDELLTQLIPLCRPEIYS